MYLGASSRRQANGIDATNRRWDGGLGGSSGWRPSYLVCCGLLPPPVAECGRRKEGGRAPAAVTPARPSPASLFHLSAVSCGQTMMKGGCKGAGGVERMGDGAGQTHPECQVMQPGKGKRRARQSGYCISLARALCLVLVMDRLGMDG